MGRVGKVLVVNSLRRVANILGAFDGRSIDEITVAVVSQLEPELGTGRETASKVILPQDVSLEIVDGDLDVLETGGEVRLGRQLHVVNLDAQVDLALAEEEAAGHPVDVRVLEESRGQ